MNNNKLFLISLGCNKNLVDSEVMLGKLKKYTMCDEANEADVLIVNTCGFISSAKEESLDAIMQIHSKRKKDSILVVVGCLTERYKEKLIKELPEVDLFCGVGDYDKIDEVITKRENRFSSSTFLIDDEERVISNSNYHAYVKISEGCNQSCSFCAIPTFKGKLHSREIASVVKEVTKLAKRGYFDFTFLSQDSSSYLRDKGIKKDGLIKLIDAIEKISGVKSARILYLYPSSMTFELIDRINESKIFHNYFDIPLQHINDRLLKNMKRGFDKEKTLALLDYIIKLDNYFLRSGFIVGYPTESLDEFKELMNFIKTYPFDRITIFSYSREEGTSAYNMEQVEAEQIESRTTVLEDLIDKKMAEVMEKEVGTVCDVVIEGYYEHKYLLSAKKLLWDRDIDGQIIINDKEVKKIVFGKIYKAKITEVVDGNLLATILK